MKPGELTLIQFIQSLSCSLALPDVSYLAKFSFQVIHPLHWPKGLHKLDPRTSLLLTLINEITMVRKFYRMAGQRQIHYHYRALAAAALQFL